MASDLEMTQTSEHCYDKKPTGCYKWKSQYHEMDFTQLVNIMHIVLGVQFKKYKRLQLQLSFQITKIKCYWITTSLTGGNLYF